MVEHEIGQPGSDATSQVAPGSVIVNRYVEATPASVWEALTDPALVCRWFGILSPGLEPGLPARLDFGDGDFFTVQDVALRPPHRLQYAWRFLGIGPLDTITWHLVPRPPGCRVTVVDREPGRPPAAGRELRTGWLDFTERLQHFLTTGTPTRYDFRRQFNASIELGGRLDVAAAVVFASDRYARWLPLDGCSLTPGTCLYVEDGRAPMAFAIEAVWWETPHRVHFNLCHDAWAAPMPCTLALEDTPRTTFLSVRHVGWEGAGPAVSEQRAQRRRFSALWIACLQRAQQVFEQERAASA